MVGCRDSRGILSRLTKSKELLSSPYNPKPKTLNPLTVLTHP